MAVLRLWSPRLVPRRMVVSSLHDADGGSLVTEQANTRRTSEMGEWSTFAKTPFVAPICPGAPELASVVTEGRRAGRRAGEMAGRDEGRIPPSCAFPGRIAAIVPAICDPATRRRVIVDRHRAAERPDDEEAGRDTPRAPETPGASGTAPSRWRGPDVVQRGQRQAHGMRHSLTTLRRRAAWIARIRSNDPAPAHAGRW
jgi:hypothetical protein